MSGAGFGVAILASKLISQAVEPLSRCFQGVYAYSTYDSACPVGITKSSDSRWRQVFGGIVVTIQCLEAGRDEIVV